MIDAKDIRAIAQAEIDEERRREAVDQEKSRIRKGRWWHRFVPKISIKIQRRTP